MLQALKPEPLELVLPNRRSHLNGKLAHHSRPSATYKRGGYLNTFICIILTGNFRREQKSKNTYNSTTLRTRHEKARVSPLCSSSLHLRPEVAPLTCSCASFWVSVRFYLCSHGVGGFPGGTSDKEPTCQET